MEYDHQIPRCRKPKNFAMKYPPPHSKSWNEEKDHKMKNTFSHNRNVNNKIYDTPPCQRFTAMRRQMQQRFRGPDPTVPHLKYGVFPKRPNRAIPTKIEIPKRKSLPSEPIDPYRRERKRPPRKAVAAKESDPLVFKTLPLDSRLMRQLTISASTHVDIKPQRFLQSMERTPLNTRSVRSTGQTYFSKQQR